MSFKGSWTLVQDLRAESPLPPRRSPIPDRLIPNDEPLALALRTRELDLRQLFTQLGQKKPPVTGIINLAAATLLGSA